MFLRPLRPLCHLLAAAGLVAALGACSTRPDLTAPPTPAPLTLTIAHLNDHHSQLEPIPAVELVLDGVATQVELGGFARQTTLFQQATAEKKNLLKLHAGDAVTGTLYYTFFKGEADARMMNTVCFDAFGYGNHEFDDGDGVLKNFLDQLYTADCQTAIVSANVVPAAGSPLAPSGTPVHKPYLVKTYDGVKVGIIGIDVAGKTKASSRPLAGTQFLDETTTAQKYIDELKGQGVKHIVLLTHQGYDADKKLAAALTDVDVIIGGDSHTLLGDFASFGLSSSGAYPTVLKNKDGGTVCIGQSWEYSKVFSLMNVKFDTQGAVASCAGNASVVIGDSFKRKNAAGTFVAVDDATKVALTAKLATDPRIKVTTPDTIAAGVLAGYTVQVEAQKAKVIGTATEALCLVRVPGETTNRSGGIAGCETANTLARGSDAAQVVAEAFLAASKRAHFALQNAGGVRTPISSGTLTMNTAFTVLPFSNVLVELDLTKARGSRFSNVQVKDRTTGVWSPIDLAKTYLLYTQTFADWLVARGGTVSRPAAGDYAHQKVIGVAGVALP